MANDELKPDTLAEGQKNLSPLRKKGGKNPEQILKPHKPTVVPPPPPKEDE